MPQTQWTSYERSGGRSGQCEPLLLSGSQANVWDCVREPWSGSGLVCRIRAPRICAAPWVRETLRLSVILLPYIRESWSAMFKLLTVDLIEDPSPSGAGNADTLLMLTNAICPRVKHGSHPSLLKVCWPFERRPHVEQPAVAYRVKRAEVVHALTALIRPQEHIVVDR